MNSDPSCVQVIQVENPSAHGIKEALYNGLRAVDFEHICSNKLVLIKPNLCYYWDYTTGETTDPRLVSALVDFLEERCVAEEIAIAESDASAMRAKHVFKLLGYDELAETKGVKLINLSADNPVEKEVTVGHAKYRLPVPQVLLDPDTVIINVPKMKIGPYANGNGLHISCALKNMFGCIHLWKKIRYHKCLNDVIVGINKLVKPQLTVVDGIIALGKHPVRLGIIVVGVNPVAVDSVVATIMRYNPKKIEHLRLAEKEGLGSTDVKVIGSSIDRPMRLFPKRNRLLFSLGWKFQLSALGIYVKLTGDVVPPPLDVSVQA